jgi:hypothetical protein
MRNKKMYSESTIRSLFYSVMVEEMLKDLNIKSLEELQGVKKE